MSHRLRAGCFELLADTILRHLRKEASDEAIMAPFWQGVPDTCGGLRDIHDARQNLLIALAETEQLLREFAPNEAAHRALAGSPGGVRKFSAYQGFQRRRHA